MHDDRTLSVAELDARLRAYGKLAADRDRRLATVFGLLLATGFVIVLGLSNRIALARPAIVAWLAALAGLALYVVVTTRSWHRRHDIRCPSCALSLVAVDEAFEEMDAGGPAPMSVLCPHCGTTVASNAA